jgi:hypothetical protein
MSREFGKKHEKMFGKVRQYTAKQEKRGKIRGKSIKKPPQIMHRVICSGFKQGKKKCLFL